MAMYVLFGQTTWFAFSVFTILVLKAIALFAAWLSFRYIPNNSVGVVEKLWSGTGSIPEGGIISLQSEAGFQSELLRGWYSLRLLAMAISRSPRTAGHYIARQDWIRVRSRWATARNLAKHLVAALNATHFKTRACSLLRVNVVANELFCVKVSTRSTQLCLSSSPTRKSTRSTRSNREKKLRHWSNIGMNWPISEGLCQVVIGSLMQSDDAPEPESIHIR